MTESVSTERTIVSDKDVRVIRPCHIDGEIASIFGFAPVRIETERVVDGSVEYIDSYDRVPIMFYYDRAAGEIKDLELNGKQWIERNREILLIRGQFSDSVTMPSTRSLFASRNKRKPRASVFSRCATMAGKYLNERVELVDEGISECLALWCLGTFVFDAFPTYPYIWAHGERGVGKSTLLETLAYLSFYGSFVTGIRPSNVYREVDSTGCMLAIDEAEGLWATRTDENARELVGLLNTGYKEGAYVPRTDLETMVVQKYRTYSPKAFASIQPIDETLANRCIVCIMRKMEHSTNLPKPHASDMRKYRDLMYRFRLFHGSEIYTSYREWISKVDLYANYGLSQRSSEMYAPLIFLAYHYMKPWLPGLERYIRRQVELRRHVVDTTVETLIMSAIYKIAKIKQKDKPNAKFWLQLTTLREKLRGTEKSGIRPKEISSILQRLGFTRSRIVKGYTQRYIDMSIVYEYAKSHDIDYDSLEESGTALTGSL